MRAFVTGSSGFVGQHLCEKLNEMNREVVGISRSGVIHDAGYIQIPCDINDRSKLKQILKDYRPNEIYHLAGPAFIPDSFQNPPLTYHVVVNGTLTLYEVVRELNMDTRILYVSSADVYGDSAEKPIDEYFPLKPNNPYAGSKACADLISEQYFRTYGLDIVIARPFNHTGPGQSENFVCSSFAKQISVMEKTKNNVLLVGNISVKRDFLDVRDVVDAYCILMEKGISGKIYNVCSGRATSLEDILSWLFRHSVITEYDVVIDPQKLRKNDVPLRLGDNTLVKNDTGWYPKRELSQTMKELLYYWRGINK